MLNSAFSNKIDLLNQYRISSIVLCYDSSFIAVTERPIFCRKRPLQQHLPSRRGKKPTCPIPKIIQSMTSHLLSIWWRHDKINECCEIGYIKETSINVVSTLWRLTPPFPPTITLVHIVSSKRSNIFLQLFLSAGLMEPSYSGLLVPWQKTFL